eukprot:6681134-Pyramimonas_sp.AAC.1
MAPARHKDDVACVSSVGSCVAPMSSSSCCAPSHCASPALGRAGVSAGALATPSGLMRAARDSSDAEASGSAAGEGAPNPGGRGTPGSPASN